MSYLLRLSSSRSDQNIGRRVVSIWHGRWQYLSRHSNQHPVCPDPTSVCLGCHVLFGLPTLLLPLSGLHIMARLADLVVGSRRMCRFVYLFFDWVRLVVYYLLLVAFFLVLAISAPVFHSEPPACDCDVLSEILDVFVWWWFDHARRRSWRTPIVSTLITRTSETTTSPASSGPPATSALAKCSTTICHRRPTTLMPVSCRRWWFRDCAGFMTRRGVPTLIGLTTSSASQSINQSIRLFCWQTRLRHWFDNNTNSISTVVLVSSQNVVIGRLKRTN